MRLSSNRMCKTCDASDQLKSEHATFFMLSKVLTALEKEVGKKKTFVMYLKEMLNDNRQFYLCKLEAKTKNQT